MPNSQKFNLWETARSLFRNRMSARRAQTTKTNAKVTVVVPVYNKADYIAESLECLTKQTLKNIQIICVDDGSTDSSRDILETFSVRDERIRVIDHQRNQGIMAARRTALLEANGDFMASVDADDIIERDMLEKLHSAAVNANADFVQCNGFLVNTEKSLPKGLANSFNQYLQKGSKAEFSGPGIFARYTSPIRVNLCLSLFSKNVYQAVTPYLEGELPSRGDDNLLTFMFMYFSRKYVFVDEALYGYRANETSSNLRHITPELAMSQIRGRAEALRFAKSFTRAVGLEWQREAMPFSAFAHSIMAYSVNFIERCAAREPASRDALTKYFFESFGEEAQYFASENNSNFSSGRRLR